MTGRVRRLFPRLLPLILAAGCAGDPYARPATGGEVSAGIALKKAVKTNDVAGFQSILAENPGFCATPMGRKNCLLLAEVTSQWGRTEMNRLITAALEGGPPPFSPRTMRLMRQAGDLPSPPVAGESPGPETNPRHGDGNALVKEFGPELLTKANRGDLAGVRLLLNKHPEFQSTLAGKILTSRAAKRLQGKGDPEIYRLLQAASEGTPPESSAGNPPNPPPQTAPAAPSAKPRSFSSEVDVPSYSSSPRPQDFALVVGIEKYASLPEAPFAERDAEAVRKHLVALGFSQRNVVFLTGQAATRGAVQGYLDEWLPRNAKPESTVFFYYSGHGAPDPKTGEAYLVPWDGNPMFLTSTAYPLKQLYGALGKLKAKHVVVALDACFSGAGGRSVLAKGARPLVTKVADGVAPEGSITVLAAASGDEITGTLDEHGHGMFTYFLLKGLSAGKRSAQALQDFILPNVQDEARRQNREQTPTILGTDFTF